MNRAKKRKRHKKKKKQRKKILWVDDEPVLLKHIISILRGKYEVKVVGDATTAREEASLYQPDLIITDNLMPGLSGLEFVKELQTLENLGSIPILMCTGSLHSDDVSLLKNRGVRVLQKPVLLDELLDYLENIFKGSSFRDIHVDSIPRKSIEKNELISQIKDTLQGNTDEALDNIDASYSSLISLLSKEVYQNEILLSGSIIILIAKVHHYYQYELCYSPAQNAFWRYIFHNISSFSSDDLRERRGIAIALTLPNPKQNEALLNLAKTDNKPEVLRLYIEALSRNRYQWAKDIFFKNLKHEDKQVRRASIDALGNYAFTYKTFDALKDALNDSSASVRHAALNCLAGFNRDETIEILVECLKSDDMSFRIDTVKALASCDTRRTTQILIDFSQRETDISVLRNIAIALGEKYRDYCFPDS